MSQKPLIPDDESRQLSALSVHHVRDSYPPLLKQSVMSYGFASQRCTSIGCCELRPVPPMCTRSLRVLQKSIGI